MKSAGRIVMDWLPVWVLAAMALGIAVPRLSAWQPLVLPALMVMVGSISLTVDARTLRGVPWRRVALVVAIGAALPWMAWGIGRIVMLDGPMLIGLVIFAAAPPELTTPVLTRVARGATAASAAILVTAGIASLAVVPLAARGVGLDDAPMAPLVASLLLGVVVPMAVAVTLRTWRPQAVGRGDDVYPVVSALMLLFVMLVVAAGNATLFRHDPEAVLRAAVAGVAVIALGAGAGRLLGGPGAFGRAATFALGARDFAVAAALVVAAGLPVAAALPAAVVGVIEMVGAAMLAAWWRRRGAGGPADAPQAGA